MESTREIGSAAELLSLVGQEIGMSDWIVVSQDRIDQFADATGDQQWIHVDVERCRIESPFGGTIAHGFLTLSLLPAMMDSAVTLVGVRMAVNYGLNKVRFPAPVPSGSRVRGSVRLQVAEEVSGGIQVTWLVTMEREGGDKPVCIAETVARFYW
jgi:acyl dehydratase